MNLKTFCVSAILTIGVFTSTGAMAQSEENPPYYEHAAVFDAGHDTLNFPGSPELELRDVGTIEFWAWPIWDELLGYDPVIVAAMGEAGPRYAIVMSDDKQVIGLYSGEDWDYVELEFEEEQIFPHHYAFVFVGDMTDVYIDGEYFDSLAQGPSDDPVYTFHIGSLNGFENKFIGEIADLRIWDVALDDEVIAADKDIATASESFVAHPDYADLVAYSLFSEDSRDFVLMNAVDEDLGLQIDVVETDMVGDQAAEPLLDDPATTTTEGETE